MPGRFKHVRRGLDYVGLVADAPAGWWEPSPWYLAQVVHYLSGALIVYVALTQGFDFLWVSILFLSFALFKEMVIDLTWPFALLRRYGIGIMDFEGDTVLGSVVDWVLYATGWLSATVAQTYLLYGVLIGCGTVLTLMVLDMSHFRDLVRSQQDRMRA